ncbi:MAG: bifunctional DNA primase/polymerase [Beijerinckiaceae bacterium]
MAVPKTYNLTHPEPVTLRRLLLNPSDSLAGYHRGITEHRTGPLIGIPTGRASRLDVLDLDPRHGSDTWLQANRDRLPATRTHATRSGGLHLLFRHVVGMRNSVGRIASGVDTRGDDGYVIWWPAVGLPVLCEASPAPWPEWLRALLISPSRPKTRVTIPDDHSLGALVRLVGGAGQGERNNLAYWAACRAGEMVASGMIARDTAAAIVAEAAMRAGLPRHEAERTAWSGIRTTAGSRP